MDITELVNEGLKRQYKVVIPAIDIERAMESRILHLTKTVKMKGFRPGKIPAKLIRRQYGERIKAEALEEAVGNSTKALFTEKEVQPVLQPDVEVSSFEEGKDLEYTIGFEIFPKVPEIKMDDYDLKRLEIDVKDKDIDDALEKLRNSRKEFVEPEKPRKAKKGDQVVFDFEGSVDGKIFEGGTAQEFPLELGSNQFIPGYEDQMIGVKAGDEKVVTVTFPEEYFNRDLAGKEAEFKVKVHKVQEAKLPEISDEFAKELSFDDVEALKKGVSEKVAEEFEPIARLMLKKDIFDQLDKNMEFEVPQGMVDVEFRSLVEEAKKAEENKDKEDIDDKEKEELKTIAIRRVKLGIILAELSKRGNVEITQDEVRQKVFEQARAFPGQEQRIFEMYQANPQLLDRLKGPILEEKTVDYVIDEVAKDSKKVTIDELIKFESEADEE